MKPLRALLLVLLVVAVLPWGAFASAHAVPVPGDTQRDASTQIMDIPTQNEAAAIGLQRRCHGPALPGSPCQPDHVLLPVQDAMPERGSAVVLRLKAGRAGSGLPPSGPLDPPRAV